MDVLEMTDPEIYEKAIAELRTQLGTAYTAKFLQQCKPNEYDYSVERINGWQISRISPQLSSVFNSEKLSEKRKNVSKPRGLLSGVRAY